MDCDSRLAALLEEVAAIPGVAALALDALRRKIEQRTFNVLVAGEFKRGKSSVINAMLGAAILPTGVVPLTSVVTLLRHADAPSVELTLESGEVRRTTLDALPDFVTERGNPKNAKGIREVSVAHPAPWLAAGLRLVDTPGIGSVHEQNTAVTRRFLPQADAVVFVASVDQPVSRNELEFLIEIRRYAGKVFILLNKIDRLSDAEVTESLAFSAAAVRDALGTTVAVFPVSARAALQGRMTHDAILIERSRMPAFEVALRHFLVQDRDAVWTASVRRHLRRLLDEAALSVELELGALCAPLAQLDSRLSAFAAKKLELLQSTKDFEALLDADARRLMKDLVERDLETFRSELWPNLDSALDDWYAVLRSRGSLALQASLEERTIDEVRSRFDAWLAIEEEAVSAAFDQLCARFRHRIDDTVNELLRYCAELFFVPFAVTQIESLWRGRPEFRYKFWTEPPGLAMMKNAVVTALPASVGHPLILRDAKRRAADLVEMQCGRLRHDFEERIKRNALEFRRELVSRAVSAIDAVQSAIENGRARRREGAEQTATRRAELEAAQRRLDILRAETDKLE